MTFILDDKKHGMIKPFDLPDLGHQTEVKITEETSEEDIYVRPLPAPGEIKWSANSTLSAVTNQINGTSLTDTAKEIGQLDSEIAENIEQPVTANATDHVSHALLEQAKKESYEEGFTKGYGEAEIRYLEQRSREDEAERAVWEQIKIQLILLAERREELAITTRDALISLSLALARKIAGDALEHHADIHISRILTETVTLLKDQMHISVFVPGKWEEIMRNRIGKIVAEAQYQGVAMISSLTEEESSLLCRVQWNQGEMVCDVEDIWNKIKLLADKDHQELEDLS